MYWTLQLATQLDEAPWPLNKTELIDYAKRSGVDSQIITNLEELDDDGEEYESITDIWSEYAEWRERLEVAYDEDEY